jgi:hypothetical protein
VLYEALSLLPSEKARVADWVVQHTENPWIPFTNFGARSLADYHVRAAAVAAQAEQSGERQRHGDAQARRAAKASHDLSAAVRRGDTQAVIALPAKGAGPLAKGSAGLDALETAEEFAQTGIREMLRAAIRDRRPGGQSR